ncbi:MAG: hypothetical protein WBK28_04160 [Minisyncoccia bacterium]
MTMQDLRELVERLEERRKAREWHDIAIALLLCTTLLGAGALLIPRTFPGTSEKTVTNTAPRESAFDLVRVSAKAAIVYDLVTGEVLYEKNAEAQLPLASLTKLLTLFAASDALTDDAPIVVSLHAMATEGETGFKEGEAFTFEELAKLALVGSSNDAAAAIAEAAIVAADAPNGGALLASAASAIGLTQTYALNGTGLDENQGIAGAYGSAHDMALLSGALLSRVPGIIRASINPTVTARSLTGNSYTLKNTNPDTSHVPGLILSKTGYTDLAGGNLSIVFDVGIGHPIAIVVLGSTKEERFTDIDLLVQATIADFSSLTL